MVHQELFYLDQLPSGTTTFLEPIGKVTIVVDAGRMLRKTGNANNTLVSNCTDAA